MRERTSGEGKRAHIPFVQMDGVMAGKMRRLSSEGIRAPGQRHHFGPQAEAVACPGKALQQPAAEEPGAPCQEKPTATELLPAISRALQNLIQVLREHVCAGPIIWKVC